jgi:hypothetical protein
MVFTGDVMLSRLTEAEIARTGEDPWAHLSGFLRQAAMVVGNLEGSVGTQGQCDRAAARENLCFSVPAASLDLLKQAGFSAMGTANNHSGDLGAAGRQQTEVALPEHGLLQLDLDHSPAFFDVAGKRVAVVALNRIPARDTQVNHVEDVDVRQKLQVAHALANWTVVFIHWGNEMTDWATPLQYEEARKLIALGADVIVGMHPHVVQPPECVEGKPVFFSLGNHLFDQKYAQTKEGMLAGCSVKDGALGCEGIYTHTEPGSYAPALEAGRAPVPVACPVKEHDTAHVGKASLSASPSRVQDEGAVRITLQSLSGQRQTDPLRLSGVWPMGQTSAEGDPLLLLLESHYSDLDDKVALRPYVYAVNQGRLKARWRGTALAYPLTDIAVPPDISGLVCGLHTQGSFLMPQEGTSALKLAYRWNGFGFSLSKSSSDKVSCEVAFGPT